MAYRVKSLVVCLVIIALPAAAQTPLLRLGDMVPALREAMREANFAQTDPGAADDLDRALTVLESSPLAAWTVEEYSAFEAGTRGLHPVALARRRQADFRADGADAAVAALRQIEKLTGQLLIDALDDAVGPTRADEILAPFDAFQSAALEGALEVSLEKLRRYEMKYGPGSTHLNGLEVLINWSLQHTPGFGPTAEGWPGPWEVVAAYNTAYLTYEEESPRLASAAEFGLRRYIFAPGWGNSESWRRILKPSQVSFGLAVAGQENRGMAWPWQGDARLGGFFAWGDLKIAYVGGGDRRVLVTRQVQIVPWAF